MSKRHNEATKAAALTAYRQGSTVTNICARYGLPPSTVRSWIAAEPKSSTFSLPLSIEQIRVDSEAKRQAAKAQHLEDVNRIERAVVRDHFREVGVQAELIKNLTEVVGSLPGLELGIRVLEKSILYIPAFPRDPVGLYHFIQSIGSAPSKIYIGKFAYERSILRTTGAEKDLLEDLAKTIEFFRTFDADVYFMTRSFVTGLFEILPSIARVEYVDDAVASSEIEALSCKSTLALCPVPDYIYVADKVFCPKNAFDPVFFKLFDTGMLTHKYQPRQAIQSNSL